MNLLIFGASGGTGRCLVEQALAQGHQVTAFTRTATKIRGTHPNQRVVEGSVQDYDAVSSAVRHIFPDKERQELVIRSSHLDWVLVRPAFLTNGPRTGRYRHGFGPHEKIKGRISRADTAEFMLKQLTDNTYLRRTPGVSY